MSLYAAQNTSKFECFLMLCSSPANFGRVCLRLAIVLALLAGLILMSELLNPHQVWPGHCAPSHCQAGTGASELDILSQVQVVDIQVIFAGNPFLFFRVVSVNDRPRFNIVSPKLPMMIEHMCFRAQYGGRTIFEAKVPKQRQFAASIADGVSKEY